MRDRTRRFTVGLGEGTNHLQVFAADPRTLEWAKANRYELTVIVRTVSDELRGRKLITKERQAWEAVASSTVMTVDLVRARFKKLLEDAFPRITFVVTPPGAPIVLEPVEGETSMSEGQATLAKLTGLATASS